MNNLSYSMYNSYYFNTYYLSYSYSDNYGVYTSYDYSYSSTDYSYFYATSYSYIPDYSSYSMYNSYTGDTYNLSYSYGTLVYTSYDYSTSSTDYSYVYFMAEEPKTEVLAQEKTFDSDSHQNLLVASLITMVVLAAGFVMMKCKTTSEKRVQIMEPLQTSITV